METTIIPFNHNEIRLKEACWIGDHPYFTRRAIGEWLEYRHPQKKIDKIIERNPHIDQFSSTVKLTAELRSGKGQNNAYERESEIRVYNPIGLQLIVFESRQPKARAFKIAVAALVYAYMRGELKPPRDIERERLEMVCREAMKLNTGHERAAAVRYITDKFGVQRQTPYRWFQYIERRGTLQRAPNPRKGVRTVVRPEQEEVIRALVKANPDITAKELIRNIPRLDCSTGRTVSNIKRLIKEQMEERVIKRLEAAIN